MNTAVTFDTHAFVRELESAGMPIEQAEAISSAVRKAQTSANLATKGDIAEVRAEIRELATKVDQNKWLLGIVLVAVLAPLLKSLF